MLIGGGRRGWDEGLCLAQSLAIRKLLGPGCNQSIHVELGYCLAGEMIFVASFGLSCIWIARLGALKFILERLCLELPISIRREKLRRQLFVALDQLLRIRNVLNT